jgi:hypothetical protein
MLVSRRAVPMSVTAMFVSGSRVFFSFVVTAMVVMMRRFAMVVSGMFVMRRRDVVMFAGRMLCLRHENLPRCVMFIRPTR